MFGRHSSQEKSFSKPNIESDSHEASEFSRRTFLKFLSIGAGSLLLARESIAEQALNQAGRYEGTGEKKEGLDISFRILYAPHRTSEDAKKISSIISSADIYIPEGFEWTNQYLVDYQDVSNGTLTDEEFLSKHEVSAETHPHYGFYRTLLSKLYNSKKQIFFVDIPKEHNLVKRYYEMKEERNIDFSTEFPEFLQTYKTKQREFAEFQHEREQYMLEQLAAITIKISESAVQFPDRKNKNKVNIALSIGIFHTRLSHELRRNKKDVMSEFSELPFIFPLQAEVQRRYMMGKDVEDELVMQALIEMMIERIYSENLVKIAEKTEDQALFLRYVASHFDLADIKSIYQVSYTNNEPVFKFSNLLVQALDAKGIEIPDTKKEFVATIRKIRSRLPFVH